MLKVHDSKYLLSTVKSVDYPVDEVAEVVFLGRSNVGKSTFINKFCMRKNLAYTSSKPGKTQTLNFYYINDNLRFVDVPGYGYAKVSKKIRENFGVMIEEYIETRDQMRFAVLLIDFKVGPTEDDILMYQFLKYYDLEVVIIATKKDKVKKSVRNKQQMAIIAKLEMFDEDDLLVYSSEDQNDVINVRNFIERKLDLGE